MKLSLQKDPDFPQRAQGTTRPQSRPCVNQQYPPKTSNMHHTAQSLTDANRITGNNGSYDLAKQDFSKGSPCHRDHWLHPSFDIIQVNSNNPLHKPHVIKRTIWLMSFLGREENNLGPRNIYTTPPGPRVESKKPESQDSSVDRIPSVQETKPAREMVSQISVAQAQALWQKRGYGYLDLTVLPKSELPWFPFWVARSHEFTRHQSTVPTGSICLEPRRKQLVWHITKSKCCAGKYWKGSRTMNSKEQRSLPSDHFQKVTEGRSPRAMWNDSNPDKVGFSTTDQFILNIFQALLRVIVLVWLTDLPPPVFNMIFTWQV